MKNIEAEDRNGNFTKYSRRMKGKQGKKSKEN